jgi:hypothetical protein
MKYKKSQFEECFCQKRIIFLTHLAYTHPLIPASGPRPPTRMSRPHSRSGSVPSCPVFYFYKNATSASVPAFAGGTTPQRVWPLLLPLCHRRRCWLVGRMAALELGCQARDDSAVLPSRGPLAKLWCMGENKSQMRAVIESREIGICDLMPFD